MEPRKQPVSPEVALASDVFDQFCNASTLKTILGHHRHLCELLRIKPTAFPQFYPKLKLKLRSWKAQALWSKFDKRASHKCYNRGKACPNTRVLIIGAGPCGLRTAIEAQLLGAKVVVVEKRDRFSRNNVLHLWPFVIADLRALGAKKFFGKFCAGSIDHISIRQLQCILLKVALILGVEIHEGVGFEGLIPPPADQSSEKIGWRAETSPPDHPVSQYEFDVLIGADGKRNTLEGFKRKEFRGKLAIAITANFINRHSEAEARVEEISGVAFIFNQKFFKDLYSATGIDLENIVYYKDETHYFVMTAKKHSLIDKGVILQDYTDTAKLLGLENVDKNALQNYAREAADFSTNYMLPHLEFAVNHYGQPDVAMFDFTSMFAAENASRVVERHGYRLLQILVGDSLLEPFWPTGSGCARGFLSSMDACWAIKSWGGGQVTPLDVVAERESIYRMLGQTTPENLHRDYNSYTLDPHTRYPNLNIRAVIGLQVRNLYDTDDPGSIEQPLPALASSEAPKKRRRRDSQVHPDTLLLWLKKQVALYDVKVENMTDSFKNGLVLCAIIHRYRPDLIDFPSLSPDDIAKNNQLAFDTLERELGVPPVMTGQEMEQCDVPDKLTMLSYLSQIYDTFRGEIPHIKHPKLELDPEEEKPPSRVMQLRQLNTEKKVALLNRITNQHAQHHHAHVHTHRKRSSAERDALAQSASPGERHHHDFLRRRPNKRRSMERDKEESQRRSEELSRLRMERIIRRQYLRHLQTRQFEKSMQMLQINAKVENEEEEPFEDFSLFVYRLTAPDFKDRVKDLEKKLFCADRDSRLVGDTKRGDKDEDFSGRVKSLEEKLQGSRPGTDKKPKDLYRAIGKIEKSDWNVQVLEKKIQENKMGSYKNHNRPESVPKWDKQQFDDKRQAVQDKIQRRSPAANNKSDRYAHIDVKLQELEKKLKEGNVRDAGPRGANKVSAMAEQFKLKNQDTDAPPIQKSNSRAALVLPAQGGSEICHFCNKRVYLMERLSAEGKFFHRGCFRCEYCGTGLRQNNYLFDREGRHGSRFYCVQHFGMPGKLRARRKSEELRTGPFKENIPTSQKSPSKTPEKAKSLCETLSKLDASRDAVDMRATPERIEFENLAGATTDVEEAPSEMDEDEWTDRNFGASAAEGSSDSVSDISDSDDDMPNEVFEEAIQQPLTADETLRLAESWQRRYSKTPSKDLQNGESCNAEGKKDIPAAAAATTTREHEADTGESKLTSKPAKNITKTANNDDEEDSESYEYDESDGELSYREYESDGDGSDTATEGEEQNDADAKARELRRQEVQLQVPQRPPRSRHDSDTNTGSETEVASDYSTDTDSEEEEEEEEEEELENSATEISTDSEFEHDGTTPTQHNIPSILIDNPALFRRSLPEEPKKVQVRSGHINGTVKPQTPAVQNAKNARTDGVRLEISPLRPETESKSSSLTNLASGNNILNTKNNNNLASSKLAAPTPLINPHKGDYFLNRTQSTEGIASKLSLQLKKKYLLGASDVGGSVKKSGSSSTLDSKVKNFVDVISEHQKKLNPAPEPSPTMQAFLQGTSNLRVNAIPNNPLSPPSPTLLNAPLKLPPSPSQTSASPRTQKEIPQLNEGFEHICGLGKKDENAESLSSLSKKDEFEHVCSLGKKQEITLPATSLSKKEEGFEHICGLGKTNEDTSAKKESSPETSCKIPETVKSESPVNGLSSDVHQENVLTTEQYVKLEESSDISSHEKLVDKTDAQKMNNVINDQESYNNLDCRPRSPAHETSIVVPDISWNTGHKTEDIETDSLSSCGSGSDVEEEGDSDDHRSRSPSPVLKREMTPPRVEIHNSSGELMEDEYGHEGDKPQENSNKDDHNIEEDTAVQRVFSDAVGSSEDVNLRNKKRVEPLVFENKRASLTSDRSSPSTPPSARGDESESFHHEGTLAALTETELSDWAQDGDAVVSEDLEDVEFNINPEFVTIRRHRKTKTNRNAIRGNSASAFAKIARGEDFGDFDEDPGHVCGKERSGSQTESNKAPSSILSNIDNIEFMDTGGEEEDEDCSDTGDTEELLDARNKVLLRNNGYVQFVDTEDDMATPVAESPRQIVPAPVLPTFIVSECEERSGEHCDSPEIFEAVNKELVTASAGEEEESSLQPEGTTTEETTTTSELATVKDNLNADDSDVFFTPKQELSNNEGRSPVSPNDDLRGQEYDEYVKRLQGRISPFHNVRDSIDVRKSRRKIGNGKVNEHIKPQECISEESTSDHGAGEKIVPSLSSPINIYNSPSTSRKLEEISRERSKQKDLIHEMVLAKHLSQRKSSQERRQRKSSKGLQTPPSSISSSQFSSNDTFQTPLSNSSEVPASPKESVITLETPSLALPVVETEVIDSNRSIHQDLEVPFVDDSVLVTEETEQFFTPLTSFKKEPHHKPRPVSVHSSFRAEQKPIKYVNRYSFLPDTPLTNPEAFSLPDIRKALFKTPDEPFSPPVAPPRSRHDRTVDQEQDREELGERKCMKSSEELGFSPDDYITTLKKKSRRPGLERSLSQPEEAATARARLHERVDHILQPDASSSMTGSSFQNMQTSLTSTASPTSSIASPLSTPHSKTTFYLDANHSSPTSGETSLNSTKEQKKSKDPERRKSIIQAVSDFFHKKKDASATPSPPKTPTTSGSAGGSSKDKFRFKFSRLKDKSRDSGAKANGGVRSKSETHPPPIPPLPVNYTPSGPSGSGRHQGSIPRTSAEDSFSEPDDDSRATAVSTPTHDSISSTGSLNRRQSRMHRRMARQAQLKRLRMAQEIQRQLEEVEVKQRELEQRGVKVEKALRGEDEDEAGAVDEAELLREWFELVRERSELRRYEHELVVRAEELQLEDRHARLQQELRDRLANDDSNKTSEDVAKEGQILGEMLEIVERRDSLIALLEEDRQRYQEEDRDFEAQMLAKGLRLTPLRKESNV
ncbi:hypothetical protein R5R35_007081 [Gryllus longicercus]|uniref:F-actin monooxygenase n=1 Tax=Gryllus longicercus TaxID=2509291 RepID=A0AAN9V7T1_9ORTH